MENMNINKKRNPLSHKQLHDEYLETEIVDKALGMMIEKGLIIVQSSNKMEGYQLTEYRKLQEVV